MLVQDADKNERFSSSKYYYTAVPSFLYCVRGLIFNAMHAR